MASIRCAKHLIDTVRVAEEAAFGAHNVVARYLVVDGGIDIVAQVESRVDHFGGEASVVFVIPDFDPDEGVGADGGEDEERGEEGGC